jgi:hypothetical protein
MLTHVVLFWLKDNLSTQQKSLFRKGLDSLKDIKSASSVYNGKPTSSNRSVVDRSYSFGLTVIFNSMADHDKYQADPIHKTFLKEFSSYWTKVVVYDFE